MKTIKLRCFKWLAPVVNVLTEAINARTIIVQSGGGIDIQESPNGTLIALSSTHKLLNNDPNDVSTGAWLTIDVMDSSCNRSTIQVWSKPVS